MHKFIPKFLCSMLIDKNSVRIYCRGPINRESSALSLCCPSKDLAVYQAHISPPQYTNLITVSAYANCFSFGVYPMAFVYIPYAITIPHTAVTIIYPYGLHSCLNICCHYTFSGYLPATFVYDGLTLFKSKTIIII